MAAKIVRGDRATTDETMRAEYERRMSAIRRAFEAKADGLAAIAARSQLVDECVARLWALEMQRDATLDSGIAIVALGGYGRAQLFPYSDIDLLFCTNRTATEQANEAIGRFAQALTGCGVRVSSVTRTVAECANSTSAHAAFSLSLLDRRVVAGSPTVFARLQERLSEMWLARDAKAMRMHLLSLTRERYAKYADTLFHLEPNIKECPGGLRDLNECAWLAKLGSATPQPIAEEFREAAAFMTSVRCFLHYRHERDDNTLDWQTQDAAAAQTVGLEDSSPERAIDGAFWMRAYFRRARVVTRTLQREFESNGISLLRPPKIVRIKLKETSGFHLVNGRVVLENEGGQNGAEEPDCVLAAFAAMAETGAPLALESEAKIEEALPSLSARLEEGPALWHKLCVIFSGKFAGVALRTMHALGLLELILPEFHGIDALVIRDAYHRYTVDEHTFVLIDALHELESEPTAGTPDWRVKFGSMMRELQHPGLLYLAALLHDTGKGRAGGDHAAESARLAKRVLARLEMDAYETTLVLQLIETHLEMSASLRRDIFDPDAIQEFAAKVQTHEALRMLTLFTYADIQAIHPDALTPWKAENLWRLSMNAATQLDRSVDEERVNLRGQDERVTRVIERLPGREVDVAAFLEGFPERYLKTRSAEQIAGHFNLSTHFADEPFQLNFIQGASMNEITLVTRDRPNLFAGMATALAAWGMNVVTADAFANALGVVVDTFRFTDTFRTLEWNEEERDGFMASLRELVAGTASVDAEKMLRGRKRGKPRIQRVRVETKIDFDGKASTHSTLLQVVAQDVAGLLRAVSLTLSRLGHNVEVALVDTEGETAIDVFYLTHGGSKLSAEQEYALKEALVEAIDENAH